MRAGFLGIDEDIVSVLRNGLTSKMPKVAAFCLTQIATSDTKGHLIEYLASSRSYHARLEAVELSAKLNHVGQLWGYLLDRHWRVRGTARFHLQKHGILDFTDYYRQRLPAPWAVAGFGEVAGEAELLELTRLLKHPQTRVRSELIRAWRNRDLRSSAAQVQSCLADSSPRVIREAIRGLRAFQTVIDAERVVQSILATEDPKRRRILVDALNLVPRWSGLRSWLDLKRKPEWFDREIPPLLWFGTYLRYYSGPSPKELEAIEGVLISVHGELEPSVQTWISNEIEYWKRKTIRA